MGTQGPHFSDHGGDQVGPLLIRHLASILWIGDKCQLWDKTVTNGHTILPLLLANLAAIILCMQAWFHPLLVAATWGRILKQLTRETQTLIILSEGTWQGMGYTRQQGLVGRYISEWLKTVIRRQVVLLGKIVCAVYICLCSNSPINMWRHLYP